MKLNLKMGEIERQSGRLCSSKWAKLKTLDFKGFYDSPQKAIKKTKNPPKESLKIPPKEITFKTQWASLKYSFFINEEPKK